MAAASTSPPNVSISALSKHEKYHVFISYSSGDSIWVHGLIHKLEETIPGLRICYHERDFLPGKTIIDNMVESIQSSQKILMVLSPDFVRSRWCLFEANLSFFQDCMGHKVIIPIMLKPCPIPLHLSHLTYLDAEDEQLFEKLVQAFLTKNDQKFHSTLVHYQPSLLYSGKTILTLQAVNEGSDSWQPGVFCSSSVPDPLRAVVGDPELYKEAIEIINDIKPSRSCLRFMTCRVLLCIISVLLTALLVVIYGGGVGLCHQQTSQGFCALLLLPFGITAVILLPMLFIKVIYWSRKKTKEIAQQMSQKTGQANLLLMKMSVLAGCTSKKQLNFVYVSLQRCKETFEMAFENKSVLAMEMWKKAIVGYSSDYTCCLAKKHFPFSQILGPSHLQDGMCFCQYVATQLKLGHWA
ncbi:uncharacterized protein O3C94_017632 [Discoglossus pictus]